MKSCWKELRSEGIPVKKCKKHEWTGYIVIFCKKCKLLKDFFDGYPKK